MSAHPSPSGSSISSNSSTSLSPSNGNTLYSPSPRQPPHSQHRHRRSNRPSNLTASNFETGSTGNGSPNASMSRMGAGFYLQPNLSGVSMDSTALLDHREQVSMRPRRSSTAALGLFDQVRTPGRHQRHGGGRSATRDSASDDGQSSESEAGENAPLIRSNERPFIASRDKKTRPSTSGSGGGRGSRRADLPRMHMSTPGLRDYGSVNFPPSVPSSPSLPPNQMQGNVQGLDLSPSERGDTDTIIHIGEDAAEDESCVRSAPPSPRDMMRSSTHRAEEDVCFPVDDGLLLEDEEATVTEDGRRRSRRREWPDLSVLEEWSREEKEERSEGIRAKKLPEPVYVGGRLRPPVRAPWHRCDEDLPYRFTYFNDELPATIHAHTISELLLPGQTFEDLFRPEPRVLDDSSSEEETEQSTRNTTRTDSKTSNGVDSGTDVTPPEPSKVLPKLGPRPTFWLDVFRPTEAEMKVLSKAFGIHPLTTEDIMMQEAREKVELFRTYYLVSYRTFEQDSNSENFMEPVNIYIVVFRDGILTFHFSMTPHPANVRRRIRQLKDYINVSSDWISYALIDDITDAFQPLIQSLENEVDDIDDAVLRMHLEPPEKLIPGSGERSDGDMLKRVGDSRRNVMSLYRLMGNKADVIKGFAKRCNEQWQVAPRSEIGLYLGDIQDHIVTMVSNLNHMEKILSRSHSNYLAQINIKMNERQEQTADVLGRLTVLGTIVLPMNIITGLWGMNVMVPGQDIESLHWFWGITACLMLFGVLCYYVAKRVYKIM